MESHEFSVASNAGPGRTGAAPAGGADSGSVAEAVEETYRHLAECVEVYADAFGPESADIHLQASKIRITVREELEGKCSRARKSRSPSSPRAGLPH